VSTLNEAPGSDGIGGRMAASGKVAMAAGADSEPETVTSAMIAAGISQLPPMDMDARRADRASDECLPGDQLSRKVWGQPHAALQRWRAAMEFYVGLDVSLKQTSMWTRRD
jgi:hypothetical protein